MRTGARRITAGLAIGILGLLGLGSGSASAADSTYLNTGVFGSGPGAGNGQFDHPGRVAAETSTGNLLVVDRGNDRVQVFDPSQTTASFLSQFGNAELEAPFGIAIDQASGDVYVSDVGNERIVKYETDGNPIPTYTLDAAFASPAKGVGAGLVGDFESALAIDPTSGDLLVADPSDNRVERFDSTSGAAKGGFDGSSSPAGAFTGLLDITTDPAGNVYVVDAEGDLIVQQGSSCGFEVGADSRVEEFSGAGAHLSTVSPPSRGGYGLVRYDPATGWVLVADVVPNNNPALLAFDEGGPVATFTVNGLPGNDNFGPYVGLATDGGSPSRFYAAMDTIAFPCFGTSGTMKVRILELTRLPTVAIDPVDPGGVTASEAALAGEVNPEGNETTWRFEVKRPAEVSWTLSASGSAGSGEVDVPVSGQAEGLEPNTTYQVRLSATNKAGTSVSAVEGFTTDPISPTPLTRFAAPRTETSARLNAFLHPHNSATTYYFEYVSAAQFEASGFDGAASVPESEDASAGDGNRQILVAERVTGLEPGAEYRYRLVAENQAGAVEGPALSFTTRSAAEAGPPKRGIELVNAPEKANQDAQARAMSPDGTKVLWSVFGGAPGSPVGRDGVFVAERTGEGPTGWRSRSVLPPIEELFGGGSFGFNTLFYEPDFSGFLFDVTKGLIGEAPHRLVGVDGDGNQALGTQVSSTESNFPDSISVTGDLGHWFATTRDRLDPAHPEKTTQLYDFSVDPPRPLSQMPGGGQLPACGLTDQASTNAANFGADPYPSATTEGDDVNVFFHTQGSSCTDPYQLYVRDIEEQTAELISGPPVAGAAGTAALIRPNPRGDEALYASDSRLDPADSNDSFDIYRWREGEGSECLTCVVPEAAVTVIREADTGTHIPEANADTVVATDDFSHILFFSQRQLEPGVEKSGLYLLHDGEIRFIADAHKVLKGGVSADGETVLFEGRREEITADPIDTDSPDLPTNLYRYDDSDRSIECLSCNPNGVTRASLGVVRLNEIGTLAPSGPGGRAISADGESAAFLTAEPLVREDINGVGDVYEWRDGRVRLVTDGETVFPQGNGSAELMGISADAKTILFKVGARLTGHERDDMAQLYAARDGGGFAPPPPPPPPCNEESCQGPLAPPPPLPKAGSLDFSGPGSSAQPRPRARPRARKCPKGKRRQRVKTKTKTKAKVRCVKVRNGKAKRKGTSR